MLFRSGFITGELSRPPAQPEFPEEYEIYDLTTNRRALEIKDPANPRRPAPYRVFPPTRPSNRSEVHALSVALEAMLDAAGNSTTHALQAWDHTFAELVRQVFVQCSDRGELLGRVRRAYGHYLSELVQRLRALEATKREQELHELKAEKQKLMQELGHETGARKQQGVIALLQRGVAQTKGAAQAKAAAEKKSTAGEKATGVVGEVIDKFMASAPAEREQIWNHMLQSSSVSTRRSPHPCTSHVIQHTWQHVTA